MPALLFKLRNVPEDEAEEIRQLLDQNNFEYYETPAGRWGISMEAIWLQDECSLNEAKKLVEEYQQQRTKKVRQEYENLKQDGQIETFFQRMLNQPVRMILSFATILIILYFVLMPFVKLSYK